jgi:hypothetical protein
MIGADVRRPMKGESVQASIWPLEVEEKHSYPKEDCHMRNHTHPSANGEIIHSQMERPRCGTKKA